ncbi:MAG: SRPBCC family protein [Salinimicrobium sediminis]|nr:SRPBCC family protein [Salinimicrobium sediminis]
MKTKKITVETLVPLPVEKVWTLWTTPEHITKWNFASPEWHSPKAENELHAGGKFNYRMEAKDGSAGFDFEGTYEKVTPNKYIKYKMEDGREAEVVFKPVDNATFIEETFDPEAENSIEMQRDGWQAILENFRNYAERNI